MSLEANNMKQIKVTKTEPYKDSQVETIVCKGKIVFLPTKQGDNLLSSFKMNEFTIPYKPIIISEIEPIGIGDKRYAKEVGIMNTSVDEEFSMRNHKGIWNKILALPEHFSPKHLQSIIDGKLKDGDEIFVECERILFEAGIDFKYKIKLNKDNHITLFSAKKEESWDDILQKYESTEYRDAPLINYLRSHYNPPTKIK